MSEIYIPSYDCSWNFVSSVNKWGSVLL
jgi:hypothetical protein